MQISWHVTFGVIFFQTHMTDTIYIVTFHSPEGNEKKLTLHFFYSFREQLQRITQFCCWMMRQMSGVLGTPGHMYGMSQT